MKFPEVLGLKVHFKEGGRKLKDWAEKWGFPEPARERLSVLCGLAVKKTIDGMFTGVFDYEEVINGLSAWTITYGLSEEAIEELAGICDFIFEFTGLAGIPAEMVDGKVFKFIFNKLKDLIFKKKD